MENSSNKRVDNEDFIGDFFFNYFNYTGNMSRKNYWLAMLVYFIILNVVNALIALIIGTSIVISTITGIIWLGGVISATTRRIRDAGFPWYLNLLWLGFPFIIPILPLLILATFPSKNQEVHLHPTSQTKSIIGKSSNITNQTEAMKDINIMETNEESDIFNSNKTSQLIDNGNQNEIKSPSESRRSKLSNIVIDYRKTTYVLLGILVVAVIAFVVLLNNTVTVSRYESLKTEKIKAEASYSRLLKTYTEEENSLQEDVYDMEWALDKVVFIPDDGNNLYHKYNCPMYEYFDGSYWAFNPESAKTQGYDKHSCID